MPPLLSVFADRGGLLIVRDYEDMRTTLLKTEGCHPERKRQKSSYASLTLSHLQEIFMHP